MRKFDLFVIVISLVAYLAAESSGFKVVNRYKRGDDEAASADSFTDMTTVNAETEIPESDYPTESTKLNSQEDVPELEEVRLPTESEDSSTPTVSIEPKTAVTSETQPIASVNSTGPTTTDSNLSQTNEPENSWNNAFSTESSLGEVELTDSPTSLSAAIESNEDKVPETAASDYPTESTKLNSQEDVPELDEGTLSDSTDSPTPIVSIEPKTAVTSETQPIASVDSTEATTTNSNLSQTNEPENSRNNAVSTESSLGEVELTGSPTSSSAAIDSTTESNGDKAPETASSNYPTESTKLNSQEDVPELDEGTLSDSTDSPTPIVSIEPKTAVTSETQPIASVDSTEATITDSYLSQTNEPENSWNNAVSTDSSLGEFELTDSPTSSSAAIDSTTKSNGDNAPELASSNYPTESTKLNSQEDVPELDEGTLSDSTDSPTSIVSIEPKTAVTSETQPIAFVDSTEPTTTDSYLSQTNEPENSWNNAVSTESSLSEFELTDSPSAKLSDATESRTTETADSYISQTNHPENSWDGTVSSESDLGTVALTDLPESSSTEAGYEQATQIVELLDESTDLRTTTDADDYLSQTNEPENGWAYITGSSEYPLSESSNDETTKAYDDTEPVVTEIDPSWGEKPESLDDEKDEPSVGSAVPNLPVPSAPAYPEPVVTEINPSWSEKPESLDDEKDEPTVGAAVPNLPVPSAPVYPEPVVTEIDPSWGEKPESLDDEKHEPTVGVAVPNLPVPSAPAYPEAPVAPIAPSYPSAPANPADPPCDDAYVPVVQPVYQDVYYNPSFGPDVPNTLYSLGGASSYPVVNYPNPVQPAQVHPVQVHPAQVHPAQVHPYYQQSAPNYEYSPQQSAYGTSGYAQQPLIPVAYAPYPNQPQYSNDPEIESLLQFTFNNYRDYQQTLVTGQRPEEAPCVC